MTHPCHARAHTYKKDRKKKQAVKYLTVTRSFETKHRERGASEKNLTLNLEIPHDSAPLNAASAEKEGGGVLLYLVGVLWHARFQLRVASMSDYLVVRWSYVFE